MANESGYCDCACRDCFDIAICDAGEPALCNECESAGCSCDGDKECDRPDAYGVGDEDDHDASAQRRMDRMVNPWRDDYSNDE